MSSSSTTSASKTSGSVDRLQGSLRNSAVARLLVEGRLTADKTAAADVMVHSPPIDLSTNRNSSKQHAGDGKVSLSTIATMERLRCIITVEVQTLLTKVGSAPSNDDSSVLFSCRLCPFTVPHQVIELLAHYRYHNDALGGLALKSPNVLCNWMEFFIKTSSGHVVRPSLSRSVPVGEEAVADAAAADVTGCSSPTLRDDLRSLLLKPFKGKSSTKAPFRSIEDRHCHTAMGFTAASAASSSSSSFISQSQKQKCQRSRSRSTTPYALISGLMNGDNPHLAADEQTRSSSANYERVSIKCEVDNGGDMTTESPPEGRSPQSPYVETKERRPNSHCSIGLSPKNGPCYPLLGRNGRHNFSCVEEPPENLSPPQLRCEREDSRSPLFSSRAPASSTRDPFGGELGDRYDDRFDSHPFQSDGKTGKKIIHAYRDVRAYPFRRNSVEDKSQRGGFCSRESSGSPKHAASHQRNRGQPEDAEASAATGSGGLSDSSSPCLREAVEQEYAYKQYKRLRKRNDPKQQQQSHPSTNNHQSPEFHGHSSVRTPDDGTTGPNGTSSTPIDDAAAPLIQREAKRDVGVQCNIPVCDSGWSRLTTIGGGEGIDETFRRKRTFPVDDDDVMTTSSSSLPDADSCRTTRCGHCGITFDDDVIFSIHMGCHSHTEPFICNICGRHCDNKYTFNTHILRGHHSA